MQVYLRVVKQACFVASVILSSVNVIQLEMKSSDGVLWVTVAKEWRAVVAN